MGQWKDDRERSRNRGLLVCGLLRHGILRVHLRRTPTGTLKGMTNDVGESLHNPFKRTVDYPDPANVWEVI